MPGRMGPETLERKWGGHSQDSKWGQRSCLQSNIIGSSGRNSEKNCWSDTSKAQIQICELDAKRLKDDM